MSFPKRSDIFQDPVWKIVNTLAKPALDTFYQVNFGFSSNVDKWLEAESTKFGGIPYARKAQNLITGSNRLNGKSVGYKLMLLCSEAEIPGTSYLTTQVDGNHQGISETFATFRQFPPLNLSFYLDSDHVVLEVFESWMKYINPIKTDQKHPNAFTRFSYPETYKETLHLTKYERDFKAGSKMSQYQFVNVWPTNMTSMRVNYGSSDVIKVSVQLAYDRFFTQFNIIDTNPMIENIPSSINDSDTIVNKNNNRWWSDKLPSTMGMNDLFGSLSNFT